MSAITPPTAPPRRGEDVRVYGFTVGHIDLPLSYFLAGEPGQINVPITAYLIDHPKGLVLFDTGLGKRYTRPAGAPQAGIVDLTEGETMDGRLRDIGVDPAEVHWIIVSHLHIDHCGGNSYFPNATVVVMDYPRFYHDVWYCVGLSSTDRNKINEAADVLPGAGESGGQLGEQGVQLLVVDLAEQLVDADHGGGERLRQVRRGRRHDRSVVQVGARPGLRLEVQVLLPDR